MDSSSNSTGWPKGRWGWLLGTIVLLAAGVVIGLILNNVVLGVFLSIIVSLGWLIAYESWRGGRNTGVYNQDDDGARL